MSVTVGNLREYVGYCLSQVKPKSSVQEKDVTPDIELYNELVEQLAKLKCIPRGSFHRHYCHVLPDEDDVSL